MTAAPTERDILGQTFGSCRRALSYVCLFSLVVNILLLTTSIYLMQIFDRVIASGSMSTLVFLTMIAAFALLVLAILEVVRMRMLSVISAWIEQRLAPAALMRTMDDAVMRAPETGTALVDLAAIRAFLGGHGVLAIFDAPWVPIYIAVIYVLHPLLGHVALAGAIALFALAVCNDIVTRRALEKSNNATQRAMQVVGSGVRNAEVVDALGMMRGVLGRWAAQSGEASRLQLIASNRATLIQGTSKFIRLLVQIAVLAVGAWLVIGQSLTGGAMIAASLIMARALAPVEQAIGTWKHAVHARQAQKRLRAFFARPPRRPGSMPLPFPQAVLAVEGAVYGFEMDRPPVLKGVSFGVGPGEAAAIVGPSAAGKSTLARLLVGIERPSVGTVRLDGADVFAWPRAELGEHLGYLPQDVELFSGTVGENIARLGEVDPERVVEAARLANCHDMILGLKDGYDTEIGDGGLRLSGGQRQRVALARALYGMPKLIVLDEPNANLDSEGELALAEAVASCKARGAAVVLIGHRPSTLMAVDRIIILIDGRIEGCGPRKEMLARLSPDRGQARIAGAGKPDAGIAAERSSTARQLASSTEATT